MEIVFRKATIADVEAIVKLCNECFEEDTDIELAKAFFEKNQYDNNQIYLVGEVNGKIIAHTRLTIIPTMFKGMDTYSILNHVCVKPEYRRCNIATYMLDVCEKISKQRNCIAMKLWSKNFRVPAHECYYHYGFVAEDAKFFSKEI